MALRLIINLLQSDAGLFHFAVGKGDVCLISKDVELKICIKTAFACTLFFPQYDGEILSILRGTVGVSLLSDNDVVNRSLSHVQSLLT